MLARLPRRTGAGEAVSLTGIPAQSRIAIAPEEIIGDWARQEASQMDQYYRQHRIRTGACLNPEMKEWTPVAMVFWTEGTAFKRQDILFKVTFAQNRKLNCMPLSMRLIG